MLVHPLPREAEYLLQQLAAAGVSQPIILFPDVSAARDYLEAALLAKPLDTRFLPCVVLLDERLGDDDVRELTQWMQAQPPLQSAHAVRLSEADTRGGEANSSWEKDEPAIHDVFRALAQVIARACE